MDYIVQVKQEPVDTSYEAVHLPTEVDSINKTSHQFEGQNGVLLKNIFMGKEQNETSESNTITIKSEPIVNGFERDDVNDEMESEEGSESKRRKTSSSLFKILNSHPRNDTSIGSPQLSTHQQPPTLARLLNGSAAVSTVSSISSDDDVQITHSTIAPITSQLKNNNSSRLQRMLTSPYNGNSPLLSSMLKAPKSTTVQSRTNSTIAKVFMSSAFGSANQTPSSSHLSTMLSQPVLSSQRPPIAEPFSHVNGDAAQHRIANLNMNSIITNGIPQEISLHSNSFLSVSDKTSSEGSSLNHSLHNHSKSRGLKDGQNDETPELMQNRNIILQSTQQPGKGGTSQEFENKQPQGNIAVNNEEFIDIWSNMITERVISEFSKNMNQTLNSFVKKAILDGMNASSNGSLPANETKGNSSLAVKQKDDDGLSKLTTCLVNSMKEKMTGIPFPELAKQIQKEVQKKATTSSENVGKCTTTASGPPVFPETLNSMSHRLEEPVSMTLPQEPIKISENLGISTVSQDRSHVPENMRSLSSQNSNIHENTNMIIDQNMQQITSRTPDIPQQDLPPVALIPPLPVKDENGQYRYLVFSCKICGKRFQHHGTLSVHLRTHLLESGKSEYVCDICGKVCTAQRYLDVHMRTHQRGIPVIPDTIFTCEICNKGFTSEEHLTIHKRMHLGEKLYQCEVCQSGFTRKSQLSIHMRIHSGEKPYVCNVCGKTFRQSNGLSLHMNVHSDDKPFACEICGKGFSRKAHYEKHMRKERGERPFTCDQCGKGFTDKFNMTVHKRIHLEDKPHKCSICGRGFVQVQHLRNHMKFHSGEKGHSCTYCTERFEHKIILLKHINSVHKADQNKDETVSTRRPKRNTNKTPKGKYYEKEGENESVDEDSRDKSYDSDGEDDSEQNPGYSDMIMHISNEMGEPFGEESRLENMFQFNKNNKEFENDPENTSQDVSGIKMEPVNFDLNSHTKVQDKLVLNYDPSVVKEEPENSNGEEYAGSFQHDLMAQNLEFDISTIKTEPLD